jgi:hypothetical protein
MKVYAVVLRRVVTAVGFLFGFGLLALIMASQASAETPAPQAKSEPLSVLAPVTGAVHEVLSPVEESVAPVVHAVLTPVGAAIAPVTRPLVDTVGTLDPVLDPVVGAVAPVTESLADPVVPAAPAGKTLPVPVAVVSPEWTTTMDAVDTTDVRVAAVGVSRLGKVPSAPVEPLNAAPSGGSGSVGGAGGSHGADATVSTPRNSLADNNSMGRSPPGVIVGKPWFGYDGRDHPR